MKEVLEFIARSEERIAKTIKQDSMNYPRV